MNKKVLIIMATYNGEKYISEQLNSICRQSYQNWNLIIQDDGSCDDTLNILNKYRVNDDRILEVRYNDTDFHGSDRNFHILINYCKLHLNDYDYYMFCDQDDIWYENKVFDLVELMNTKNANEPLLAYADMKIVDGNGNYINEMKRYTKNDYTNWQTCFFIRPITGCNLIMNKSLFLLTPAYDDFKEFPIYHDMYYSISAATIGKICYFDKILMAYRRHDKNVTSGNYKFSVKKIKKLFNNEFLEEQIRIYIKDFIVLNKLKKGISYSESKMKDIVELKKAIIDGGWFAFKYLKRNPINCGRKLRVATIKFVLFLKLHKKKLKMKCKEYDCG